jgi:streptomycin 6-kinase
MSTPASFPTRLAWLSATDRGRAWLEALPGVVEECRARWSLRLEEPFSDSYVSLVLPAELADGGSAVLKVQFPHRESEHEADALALWNGGGAVWLLAHDHARNALLLERCLPGTPLTEAGSGEALDVLVSLLPRLWKPAGSPFRSLAEEARWWADDLQEKWEQAGRPFERELLMTALDALHQLPPTQPEQVLLNQDLHADNVLRAQREPWLVIDPKPLAGERAFSAAPIIRSFELGHGQAEVVGRLDRLTAELGLDRERTRLWSLAQTIAWCFESDYMEQHVETARWLHQAA